MMDQITLTVNHHSTGYDRLRLVLAGEREYAELLAPYIQAALAQVAIELGLSDDVLQALITQLKPEQYAVMLARFPGTSPGYTTLDDTSKALGITRERVRQREANAIMELRKQWRKSR